MNECMHAYMDLGWVKVQLYMLTPQRMGGDHVPSLQSLSGPHQAAPPGQLAGHRPPESVGSAWGPGLGQIAHFPEECGSGSMPAGARRPQSPGHRRIPQLPWGLRTSFPRSPHPSHLHIHLAFQLFHLSQQGRYQGGLPTAHGPHHSHQCPFWHLDV